MLNDRPMLAACIVSGESRALNAMTEQRDYGLMIGSTHNVFAAIFLINLCHLFSPLLFGLP